MLMMLAQELGKLPNTISIEGHTDSKPFAGTGNYSNWELSADRANAARRLMQQNGLRADQVTQVRGYADQRLRKPDEPEDASNRRISVIVQYLGRGKDDDEKEEKTVKGGEKPPPGNGHGKDKEKKPAHECLSEHPQRHIAIGRRKRAIDFRDDRHRPVANRRRRCFPAHARCSLPWEWRTRPDRA